MSKDKKSKDILALQGCKITKTRRAIIKAFEDNNAPLSAEDIFNKIGNKGVPINLSTIYRNLEMMINKGYLEKTNINSSKSLYCLSGKGHNHRLICTECHKMVSIDTCPIKKMEKNLEDDTQFDITGHKFELYGLCPQCKIHKKN